MRDDDGDGGGQSAARTRAFRAGRVVAEMKLPNAAGRRTILERQLEQAGNVLTVDDCDSVIAATEGFTGADLKRLVEDAKGLFAFDRVNSGETADSNEYLLRAAEAVALNKKRYAEAETGARGKYKPANPVLQLLSQMPMGGLSFSSDWADSGVSVRTATELTEGGEG